MIAISTAGIPRLARPPVGSAIMSALFIVALAAGCAPARTEINSFVDPDFSSRVFTRVLVAPCYADLGDRAAIEDAFVQLLADTQTQGVASITLLPPTRDWKDEDIFPLMAEQKIDGVLLITQTGAFHDREYVPERVDIHTDEFLSARSFRGSRRWGYGRGYYDAHITRSGGYYVDLPRVRNELRLYDVATRKQAWFATTLTAGDSSASREEMIDSFAKETIAKLTVDGLVRARARHNDDEDND